MRVFLDANVLVSAFASRGLCADLLEVVLLEHDLVLGRNVVRELSKALRQKLKLPPVRAAEIVEFVSGEAAQLAHAEVFVTGDAALLKLGAVEKLAIVTPRRFWEVLHTDKP